MEDFAQRRVTHNGLFWGKEKGRNKVGREEKDLRMPKALQRGEGKMKGYEWKDVQRRSPLLQGGGHGRWAGLTAGLQRNWLGKVRKPPCTRPSTSPRQSSQCW